MITAENLTNMFRKFLSYESKITEMQKEIQELKETVQDLQNDKIYTVKEAAEVLQVSVSSLYRYVSEGRISYSKPAGVLYFSFQDLKRFAGF